MNCVVICCDTFRADMLGHDVVRVPNLDRLMQQGITFTHAFAEGLPTIQARRTMMTGIRSFPWRFEMGCRGLTPAIPGWHRVPDEQTMLSEVLLESGVCTGLVGDTYHMFKPTQNFTRGFCSWDFIRGQEGDPVRSGPLSAVDVAPYHPEGKNDHKVWPTLTQYLLNMLDRHCEEDYLPPRVFRRACKWLDENRANAPWMLWIDSFAPHERWDPPFEFADAYYTTAKSRNYIQPQLINNKPDITDEEIQRTRALYYGYVTFVDKWVGAFLDKLGQMHLLDETVVIFTSDHGTELWDKGRFGKNGERLYAYNTRIPLVVRLPGARHAGTKRHDLCQHQDLMPTVCALMGCDPPARAKPLRPAPRAKPLRRAKPRGGDPADAGLTLDGRDLFDPAAADAEPQKAITAWGPTVSVRDRKWNLVIDSTGQTDRRELYDLAADPDEAHNVYDRNPAVVGEITAYLEETLGPLPYAIQHTGDKRQAPPLIVRYR